jgi:transcriptional regulator with XRE-family HTH domain
MAELPKFADRGARLSIFYHAHGYKSKRAFADRMGIKEQSVNKYLQGIYDPLKLVDALALDGCNINWLATGEKPELPQHITDMDRLMLKRLKESGIDNPQKLEYLLNPETLAHDVSYVLHERLAKYSPKGKKK